jgi:hypothetical protein
MRCRQADKLIFDYIDGLISESDRLRLERHLSECRRCEATSSAVARSLGLLHRLPKAEPSENFNWKLRLRLSRERNALRGGAELERVWPRAWRSTFALGAASAFVVALAAGFVFLKYAGGPGAPSPGLVAQPDQSGTETQSVSVARSDRKGPAADPGGAFDFGGFGAHSVSSGSASPLGFDAFGDGTILAPDSLGYRPITARGDYQRIRQLELQVEILRKELENCNLECGGSSRR